MMFSTEHKHPRVKTQVSPCWSTRLRVFSWTPPNRRTRLDADLSPHQASAFAPEAPHFNAGIILRSKRALSASLFLVCADVNRAAAVIVATP